MAVLPVLSEDLLVPSEVLQVRSEDTGLALAVVHPTLAVVALDLILAVMAQDLPTTPEAVAQDITPAEAQAIPAEDPQAATASPHPQDTLTNPCTPTKDTAAHPVSVAIKEAPAINLIQDTSLKAVIGTDGTPASTTALGTGLLVGGHLTASHLPRHQVDLDF